jgi:hypothetical protein
MAIGITQVKKKKGRKKEKNLCTKKQIEHGKK